MQKTSQDYSTLLCAAKEQRVGVPSIHRRERGVLNWIKKRKNQPMLLLQCCSVL